MTHFSELSRTITISQYDTGGTAHGQVGGQLGVLLPEAVPLVQQRNWDVQPVGRRRQLRRWVPLRHLRLAALVVLSLFDFLLLLRLSGNGWGVIGSLWRWLGIQGEVAGTWLALNLFVTARDLEVGGHLLGIGACGAGVFAHY